MKPYRPSRWNLDNLKIEGVMFVPNTDIMFIEVAHPVAKRLLLLNKMRRVENYYRTTIDVFYAECELLRLWMLSPHGPITRARSKRLCV
jgi:hypothetical protein